MDRISIRDLFTGLGKLNTWDLYTALEPAVQNAYHGLGLDDVSIEKETEGMGNCMGVFAQLLWKRLAKVTGICILQKLPDEIVLMILDALDDEIDLAPVCDFGMDLSLEEVARLWVADDKRLCDIFIEKHLRSSMVYMCSDGVGFAALAKTCVEHQPLWLHTRRLSLELHCYDLSEHLNELVEFAALFHKLECLDLSVTMTVHDVEPLPTMSELYIELVILDFDEVAMRQLLQQDELQWELTPALETRHSDMDMGWW